tara:strand:+ start:1736 stop:2908 length:1173 start_codon:yes stop_codon:yes gene_type:complete
MGHDGLYGWTKVRLGTHPGAEMPAGGSSPFYISDTFWVGMGFPVTEDCNLTAGVFDLTAITGTPPLYKMEVWPLSTSNLADPDMSGTVLAETASLDLSSADLGRQEHAFSSSYAASKGEHLFILIRYASGTYSASNRIEVRFSGGTLDNPDFPFASYTSNSGTSWTQDSHECPNFAVVTNKNYDLGCAYVDLDEKPYSQTGAHILDTTGDRVCNEMTIPSSDMPIKMTVSGFRFIGKGPQAGDDCRVGVWNSAGSLLGGTLVSVTQAGGYPGVNDGWLEYYFDDDVEMESGGTYYIGFERTAATFDLTRALVSSLDYPGDLTDAKKAFRVWPFSFNCWMKVWDESDGTPAWKHDTVDPYCRLLLDPILSDIHAASSGGGSTTGATMGVIG